MGTIFTILASIAAILGVLYLIILAVEKSPIIRAIVWGVIIIALLSWLGFATLIKWVGIIALLGVIFWLKEALFD